MWLARDELLDRPVALKELLSSPSLTDAQRTVLHRRTLAGARAAARLDHPAVVRVYDVLAVADQLWIVMEYVPSRSLRQTVTEDGPLDPRTVARVGLDVVGALRAAHRVGVLHRDVSPRTVLVAEDGRALLGDFGAAVVEGGATDNRGLIASPQFVAPERVRQGVSSPAADLWSLGATLYAAVEGRPPYERPGVLATLTAVATEPPDPTRRAGPLAPVIAGLLDREPRRRLTAGEAAQMLRRIATPPARRGLRGIRFPAVGHGSAAQAGGTRKPSAVPRIEVEYLLPESGVTRGPSTAGTDERTQVLPTVPAAGDDRTPATPTGDLPAGPTGGLTTTSAGARPVDGADRRAGRRSAVVFVGTVVALAVVAGATWVGVRAAVDNLSGVLGRTSGPVPVTAPGTPPTTTPGLPGAPCLTPAGTVRQVTRGASATARQPFPLPPGWFWYQDEAGFTVGVPEGWRRFTDGDVVCLGDPRGAGVLAVDVGVTAVEDPSGYWTGEVRRLTMAGGLPDYVKVSIGPVIQPGGAAEWEYTWTGPDGQRRHARRVIANGKGRPYELSWVTADRNWAAAESYNRLLSSSFRVPE